MLALNPSAIARPAASSEPQLMREPDDIRNSVLCRFDPVIASWFCAARDGILFRMLNAIRFLLFVWSRLPWNVLPRFRLQRFCSVCLTPEPKCLRPHTSAPACRALETNVLKAVAFGNVPRDVITKGRVSPADAHFSAYLAPRSGCARE